MGDIRYFGGLKIMVVIVQRETIPQFFVLVM